MAGRKQKRAGHVRASTRPPERPPAGRHGRADQAADLEVQAFVDGLTEAERIVVVVRDELYDGSWEDMREDLEARAAGRPYVFKLAGRIEEDLKAIDRLRKFEQEHRGNLAEYMGEG